MSPEKLKQDRAWAASFAKKVRAAIQRKERRIEMKNLQTFQVSSGHVVVRIYPGRNNPSMKFANIQPKSGSKPWPPWIGCWQHDTPGGGLPGEASGRCAMRPT